MSILIFIFLSCLIAMIMLVWFKSEAVLEFGRLLGLSNFLRIDEFKHEKMGLDSITYPQFLKMKSKRNFFLKLITCPLCLSVWLSVLFCVVAALFIVVIAIVAVPASYGIVVSVSSILSAIISIPIVNIGSLLIYGTVNKLLS